MSFYVFSRVTEDAREWTGIVGFRDVFSFDTKEEAEVRRQELKAGAPLVSSTDLPIRGHVIREEQ